MDITADEARGNLIAMGIGEVESKQIELIVDKLFNAAKRCQLTEIRGTLDYYAELSSVVGAETEKIPPRRLAEGKNLKVFWDYVDNGITKFLNQNCQCGVR